MSSLVERIMEGGVIITDGAMGSNLLRETEEAGVHYPTELVRKNRQAVVALQERYHRAGTKLLLTCTFSGAMLSPLGYSDKEIVQLNRDAVAIAREVMGPDGLVAGDIGPTGMDASLYDSNSGVTIDTVKAAFRTQVIGLSTRSYNGDVQDDGIRTPDLYILETFHDLNELGAGIDVVREFAPDKPIVVSMSFDKKRTRDGALLTNLFGVSPKQLARFAFDHGIRIAGANCGLGHEKFSELLDKIGSTDPKLYLWAKPNAGLPGDPVLSSGQIQEITKQLLRSGAHFIGWCCGSDPERYIAETANTVAKLG